jgi:hypothetical protein
MFSVSKSGLINTIKKRLKIVNNNHKGWVANQPFPKILNGKLQIGTAKGLDMETNHAKIKGKNMWLPFFNQTVDRKKIQPIVTFAFFLQGCMTKECAVIFEQFLGTFRSQRKFCNPNWISAYILLPINTMPQILSEHFKE